MSLMKCTIHTSGQQPLQFSRELPAQFQGPLLPGGNVFSASGSFGELCIQEFDGGDFVFRYSVLHTNEPVELSVQSHHSGLHAAIMLRNGMTPVFATGEKVQLRERQFTIVHAHEPKAFIRFQGNQNFICFETLLSPELYTHILKDFPELLNVLKEPPANRADILVNPAKWTDEEVSEHIRYILTYSDPARWRRTYFANRVSDIVGKLVIAHLNKKNATNNINQEHEKKAYALQRLILDNLDKHILIKDLARKMGSSESTLKRVFSIVFGMGIHKYRIYKRLQLAIRLLHEGKSVKETAAKTGWRSADLIDAYQNVYGTTPGAARKKA